MMDRDLPSFNEASVLVIGDVMLDSYWHGKAERLSPEAPVPVVKVAELERRLGGAANVALNMKTLGAQVSLLGVVGCDAEADSLRQNLKQVDISSYLQPVSDRPTITKLRVISQQQQLLRLDFEKNFQDVLKDDLLAHYKAKLSDVDLVVLSDYAKGTLSNVAELIQLAIDHGKPVIVDPKGQDYSNYQHATLLTPNLKEFESIVGPLESEEQLVIKGMALLKELSLDALLITRGEAGMTLLQQGEAPFHLKTEAKEVFDVTGAGDTVIGVLSAALAAKTPIKEAISWANKAAGIVVSRLGASSVTADCLKQASVSQNITQRLTFNELLEVITQHQQARVPYKLFLLEPESMALDAIAKIIEASEQGLYCYVVLPEQSHRKRIEILVTNLSFLSGHAFLSTSELSELSEKGLDIVIQENEALSV